MYYTLLVHETARALLNGLLEQNSLWRDLWKQGNMLKSVLFSFWGWQHHSVHMEVV